MRNYYTEFDIFVAWIKKKLGVKSPSALSISSGKYEYEYDYIMKTKAKLRGE